MLNAFKHLLPNSRAWRLTTNKQLRQFFQGLAGVQPDVKGFLDDIWFDIFPETTREIGQWEQQFGLTNTGLTEQEKRDRLDATWKAVGGQDPRYIQDTLQSNGFNVFVHEWWVPGSEPPPGTKACVTPRSPLAHLRREFTGVTIQVECGEALAACGEAFAEAGNALDPSGYPLVNKILETSPDLITSCGEALAACGEPEAACGNYIEFRQQFRNYVVPLDSAKWPYFLYIGGAVFGEMAVVDPARRDEFETLCLKICPAQQWLGILVSYT